MDKKVCWMDTETTGLNAYKNDVHQIAGIIEINGIIKERFNYKVKPFNFDNIEPDALKVSGVTVEQLKKYPDGKSVHLVMVKMLEKYCNKFEKTDKFYLAGQKIGFDADFVKSFFFKCGDKFFGSWFNYDHIDLKAFAAILKYCGALDVPNLKLTTLAEKLGIKFKAHDAMHDIETTREIMHIFMNKAINKKPQPSAGAYLCSGCGKAFAADGTAISVYKKCSDCKKGGDKVESKSKTKAKKK